MTIQQRDNGRKGAFYIEDEKKEIAEMVYSWPSPDLMIIEHTEVDSKMEGKGIGRMLVDRAVEFAREKGFKILPLCTYASSVFKRKPEYADVLKK